MQISRCSVSNPPAPGRFSSRWGKNSALAFIKAQLWAARSGDFHRCPRAYFSRHSCRMLLLRLLLINMKSGNRTSAGLSCLFNFPAHLYALMHLWVKNQWKSSFNMTKSFSLIHLCWSEGPGVLFLSCHFSTLNQVPLSFFVLLTARSISFFLSKLENNFLLLQYCWCLKAWIFKHSLLWWRSCICIFFF